MLNVLRKFINVIGWEELLFIFLVFEVFLLEF